MNGDSFKRCRICGKKIGIITQGIYRKCLVDADAVEIVADPEGETFVRIDGCKVIGKEIEPGIIQAGTEWAYRPHRRSCEVRYEV